MGQVEVGIHFLRVETSLEHREAGRDFAVAQFTFRLFPCGQYLQGLFDVSYLSKDAVSVACLASIIRVLLIN